MARTATIGGTLLRGLRCFNAECGWPVIAMQATASAVDGLAAGATAVDVFSRTRSRTGIERERRSCCIHGHGRQ